MKLMNQYIIRIGSILCALLAPACSSDGSSNDSNEDNESEDQQDISPEGTDGTACFEALEGGWTLLSYESNNSQCDSWSPVECDVSQDGCNVTLNCSSLGQMTLAIDADGVTDSMNVNLGNGIVATCHAEFGEEFGTSAGDVFWMSVTCAAQGITCEYGESKVYSE